MLDWLKKLGGSKPFENKAGLDAKSLKLLAEDFAPLDELAPDLAGRVTRFVVDGEGEDVLAEIAALKQASEKLLRERAKQLRAGKQTAPRSQLFQSVRCGSLEFFRRLGRAYQAGTQLSYHHASGAFEDSGLDWLEVLLVEGAQLNVPYSFPCPALSAELLEALIEMEGRPRELLVRTAFQPKPKQGYGCPLLEPIFAGLEGLAGSALRHREALLAALDHADSKQRVYALSMMKKCRVPPEEFADKLVELAVGSGKQVREFAESLLEGIKPAVKDLLVHKASEGANEERSAAVRLLWRWAGENARAFMEYRLTLEKSTKVSQTIRDLLGASLLNAASLAEEVEPQLPPLAPIPARLPLGAEPERAWRECFDKVNAGIAQLNAGALAKYPSLMLKPVSAGAISKAFADLQGGRAEPDLSCLAGAGHRQETGGPLLAFWQRPELQPVHLVRFFVQVCALQLERGPSGWYGSHELWLDPFITAYHRTHPEAGLREFGAAYAAAGLDADRIGRLLLNRYFRGRAPFGMPPAQVWPYWAEHLDLLERAFGVSTGNDVERYVLREARAIALDVLACFPKPPAQLAPILWDLALGPKGERPQAQRCLAGASGKLERLTAALTSGSTDARLAAAEWLGRLGEKSATEALLAAFQREKNEAAKGAMMAAMEQLGAPVDQFLDRDGLLKEAEKGVAKGAPEDLKWFPFDQLPVVRWQDTGKSVEPAIVQWWMIQGCKLKNPVPGALLRRYCAGMELSGREALGQFILEAWIAEDIAPIPRAEAEQQAMSTAQNTLQAMQIWVQQAQQNPQRQPPAAVLTLQEYYERALASFVKQVKGSAIASKGILSVAGACAGAAAVPVVNRYLKEWFGMRAAQCRALLQMLAWVEHKTATQLLLAVGSRFRTKGIQEEANTQAQALAERKGWTVAELADRTIPSAGMDEEGVLTLDFGPRQFTARLNEDFEFVLADADGKALKSLPDPRKDDDESKAAGAKKNYSAAKRELKSVVTMQRDRLYEAMCTQRTWPFEDWNVYLNRHPIARYHCQRLIWAAIRDEKVALLFRPLPDGSLTDAADDPVTLRPDDLVRVAYECQITPQQSQAWRQHLKDYDVEPLFEQFGRPNFELAEECEQESELTDFRGHILEAFKLRGRANKLGYTRGQAQDGGWFYDYHKRFPTLGMEAVIEFTGNGLPEENRTVALTVLHFDRVATEGEPAMGGGKMSLGEVPPVLLRECWNDIRQMAAEGAGFDADWEKKAQM